MPTETFQYLCLMKKKKKAGCELFHTFLIHIDEQDPLILISF